MKDIAKKILIGVVILEIIIIMISAVIIIKSKYFKAEENIESQFEEIAEVEGTEEQTQNEENNSDTNGEEQEEITIEDKIEEDNSTEQIKIDEPKTTVQSQVVQNNKNSENPSKITSKNTNTNNNINKSNSTSVQTTIETNTKKEEINNPQTVVQNNNTSSNTETKKVPEVPETPKTNTVTYKYNENMTNKMISVIKANESDYMKEYGYTVVIDESIITLTNQFTYSDQRVKDKLTYKFGQIRVYARDYFVKGEYKWTECYII